MVIRSSKGVALPCIHSVNAFPTQGGGGGGGGYDKITCMITADLAVFLCIEFPLKTTRLFVRSCCSLWGSRGIVGDKWKPATPRVL